MSTKFLVCLENRGYEASLEKRKIYQIIEDETAKKQQLVRVIDESGEDYLFPKEYFAPIELPNEIVKALTKAA